MASQNDQKWHVCQKRPKSPSIINRKTRIEKNRGKKATRGQPPNSQLPPVRPRTTRLFVRALRLVPQSTKSQQKKSHVHSGIQKNAQSTKPNFAPTCRATIFSPGLGQCTKAKPQGEAPPKSRPILWSPLKRPTPTPTNTEKPHQKPHQEKAPPAITIGSHASSSLVSRPLSEPLDNAAISVQPVVAVEMTLAGAHKFIN